MRLSMAGPPRQPPVLANLKIVARAQHGAVELMQYENGSIAATEAGAPIYVVKPLLRRIAGTVGVDVLNGNGNPKNTRSLGYDVIRALQDLS